MRLGKASITKVTAKSRQTGKSSIAYRVMWRVYLPDGTVTRRKKSGFATKGAAEVFAENLGRADRCEAGWCLDRDGFPIQPAAAAASGPTVLGALETFVALHWTEAWPSPNTRSKNRGRLLALAIATLDEPRRVERVWSAFEQQRSNAGTRPEPDSMEAWAARYLRDHALDPGSSREAMSVEMQDAQTWLEAHSLPVTALDDERLGAVRNRFSNLAHSTRRTYWATTKMFLSWLVTTGRLPRDPAAGLPKIKRDLLAEKVDPRGVPTVEDIGMLANEAEQRFGTSCAALITVLFYGALRIGEAAGLRWRHVEFHDEGHALITVEAQEGRTTARYNAGRTRRAAPPKGRTEGPDASRLVPLPPTAARLLRKLRDASNVKDPDAFVFAQRHGRPLDDSYFRDNQWHPLVQTLFGPGHRLAGITPHACRHGGMTRWLRLGIPLKAIQEAGGWASLKVLLDTYAAALPDDLDLTIAALNEADQELDSTSDSDETSERGEDPDSSDS